LSLAATLVCPAKKIRLRLEIEFMEMGDHASAMIRNSHTPCLNTDENTDADGRALAYLMVNAAL
jgi:hypothetical protein